MNELKILESVKGYLPMAFDEDESFDSNLLISIGSYVASLGQMIDIKNVAITSDTKYSDVVRTDDANLLMLIQHYIALRTRLDFDPPAGTILESLKNTSKELETRIMMSRSNVYDNEQ